MRGRTGLIILLLFPPIVALGQISPGRLARGHAELEGITGCTSCHPYGKSLSNEKCLNCHGDIRASVDSARGVHGHLEGRACAGCHSDHNGEDFQIVRFDTAGFDHRAASGFPLAGRHGALACDSCHSWKRVAAPVVKVLEGKRPHTYLGLSPACLSCHADTHRGQFSGPCSSCHDTRAWKPAPVFSHDRSRYPLTGKHAQVACRNCHAGTVPHSQAVLYRGMDFSSCKSCHGDPHKEKFPGACDRCHTTGAWKAVKGERFDHARTEFPLGGKHAGLPCAGCHAAAQSLNAAGERGFHISRFRLCADCHRDAHGGQFSSRADGGKCESCHDDRGFNVVLYTIESHNQSAYPLRGAHVATSCLACHREGIVRAKSSRQYRWEGKVTCLTCHRDPHGEQFAKEHKACETCHIADAWGSLLFDHGKTSFPLEGKHGSLPCVKCHEKGEPVRYAGIATTCSPCHKDPHERQFDSGGRTRCESCHDARAWTHITFDHTTASRFPLKGAHAEVACARCHPGEPRAGTVTIRYKPLGTACEDCHKTAPHELPH